MHRDLKIADKTDAITIEIINKTKCRFKQSIYPCLKVERQLPVQNTGVVLRYHASSQLEDIIHWYQYFGSKYSISLAVPIIGNDIDES